MAPTNHAILGASSAYRWMACTPSARIEESMPESGSSFAEEGTLAHAVAELYLRHVNGELSQAGFLAALSDIRVAHPEIEDGMISYVKSYADSVTELYNTAQARTPDAQLIVEQKVDFGKWVPDGFGTSDAVIIADDVMDVCDLKYGKGVPVSAENNPQLRLYALGSYMQAAQLYDIRTIRMTIIQPRLDSISTEEMPAEELIRWADEEVRPKAELAYAGKGEFHPGAHCQFCRAKATCRARAEENLKLAEMDFKQPPLLSEEEIGKVLSRIDELISWAGSVHDYAYQQAIDGHKYEGWKLVAGRSTRKYSDEQQAAGILEMAGYDDAVIYERKLLGITAMEKLVGKKELSKLLGDIVIKPDGKPVLVPEDDHRPEIGGTVSAAEDFS